MEALPVDIWSDAFSAYDTPSHIGKFVRLAPTHLSIADPEAVQVVYGHGTGTLKSEFCQSACPV